MNKVKQYLKELELFVKAEQDAIKKMVEAGIYNEETIASERKKSHTRIQDKQVEIKAAIDQFMDDRISAISKENACGTDIMDPVYQSYQTNVLMKLQILGNEITEEMLKGMIQPIVDRKDNFTLEAIRAEIKKKSLNNDDTKKKLLSCVPRYDNRAELLRETKKTIDHLIVSNAFENASLSGVIGLKYLEQAGLFEL